MDGLSISATGIQAATQRLNVIANNVANVATPNFQASRADSVELAGGGVGIGSITVDSAPGAPGGSNVNLATEMTGMIVNRNAHEASASAFKVQSDLLGELLDLNG